MASHECYDCFELFPAAQMTERVCCHRRFCWECLKDNPTCLKCPNVARIEVDSVGLQQEISRVNEVLQEQVDFYFKFGSVDGQLTPVAQAAATADAKAVQLHLELLTELQLLLALHENTAKTVWIPDGVLVRSKDRRGNDLIDSHGVITVQAYNNFQQDFYERHKIYHAWEGVRPPLRHQYLKRLQLGAAGFGVTQASLTGETGLARLKNMTLTHLVMNFAKITDLTALGPTGPLSQHLVELSLYASDVTDITALAGMKILRCLDLGLTPVSDITALTGLALTELDLGATRVADITALTGMPLVILRLNSTNVTDLTPLRGTPLVQLALDYTPVRDLSPLANLPLRKLSLFMTEADVTPVAGIAGLEIVTW